MVGLPETVTETGSIQRWFFLQREIIYTQYHFRFILTRTRLSVGIAFLCKYLRFLHRFCFDPLILWWLPMPKKIKVITHEKLRPSPGRGGHKTWPLGTHRVWNKVACRKHLSERHIETWIFTYGMALKCRICNCIFFILLQVFICLFYLQ